MWRGRRRRRIKHVMQVQTHVEGKERRRRRIRCGCRFRHMWRGSKRIEMVQLTHVEENQEEEEDHVVE
jgi:hypothetical protein